MRILCSDDRRIRYQSELSKPVSILPALCVNGPHMRIPYDLNIIARKKSSESLPSLLFKSLTNDRRD